jgi:hypothetical protein
MTLIQAENQSLFVQVIFNTAPVKLRLTLTEVDSLGLTVTASFSIRHLVASIGLAQTTRTF